MPKNKKCNKLGQSCIRPFICFLFNIMVRGRDERTAYFSLTGTALLPKNCLYNSWIKRQKVRRILNKIAIDKQMGALYFNNEQMKNTFV